MAYLGNLNLFDNINPIFSSQCDNQCLHKSGEKYVKISWHELLYASTLSFPCSTSSLPLTIYIMQRISKSDDIFKRAFDEHFI